MPPMPPSLLPKVQFTKPTWNECTVIFRDDSGRIRTVDGLSYGTLAVHVTQDGNLERGGAAVTITHLPSKVSVLRVEEVADAMAIAERLWDQCREAWCRPGEPVDVAKIPANVVQWIKRCSLEKKLVVE